MKALDLIVPSRWIRLSPHERLIALILIVVLTVTTLAAIDHYNHSKPVQRHDAPSVFDYPVAKPGFTIAAHLRPKNTATFMQSYLGPSGEWHRCITRSYYLVPYQVCTLLIQPETTRAIATWFAAEAGDNAEGARLLFGGLMTAACGALVGFLGTVCGVVAWWAAGKGIREMKLASSRAQCLRLDWNYVPSPSAFLSIATNQPPIPKNISAYGAWQTWVVERLFHNGQWDNYWVWDYPTHCIMPRDCIPRSAYDYGCII